MSTSNPSFAILVHACDRYEFLFRGFAYFFKKYWDFDIPLNYYFATEDKEVQIEGFKNIHSGKGQWSDRLRILCKDHIPEDYLLYFQEDMWLNKPVNGKFFIELFDFIKSKGTVLTKLHSSSVYKTIPLNLFIEGFNVSRVNIKESSYLMSHQASIWKRDFLIEQMKPNENPWRNEKRGSRRIKKIAPEILILDYFAENGKPEINQNKNPLGRSDYSTISVNAMLNHNILPYINELMQSEDEETKQYAVDLQNHYEMRITHDGLHQPRKDDFFKTLRNKIKGK